MEKVKQEDTSKEKMIEAKTSIVSITLDGVEYVAKSGIISIPAKYAWALKTHG